MARSPSARPRILHVGLGEIGRGVVQALVARNGSERKSQLVGVVDASPTLSGKRLRELMTTPGVPHLTVDASVTDALKRLKGAVDVAIVTTGSTTEGVQKTLMELADAGVHVVSSCEELAYPTLRSPKLTDKLDAYAAKRNVVLLGTGVNPGYAMDVFALTCTAPCTVVRGIKVIRSLDASKRRYQLQKKVAAGMDVAAVKKLIREKRIGHVGLSESIAMVAKGLGWKLDKIEEKFEPLVADHLFFNEHFRVQPGQVRGLWMRGFGKIGKRVVIELDLTMAFDVDSFDEVIIDGDPPLLVRTKSGFPGDASTVGMLVNCADCVQTLDPGVRTMLDVLRVRSIGV